jgi:hypothetical protein
MKINKIYIFFPYVISNHYFQDPKIRGVSGALISKGEKTGNFMTIWANIEFSNNNLFYW